MAGVLGRPSAHRELKLPKSEVVMRRCLLLVVLFLTGLLMAQQAPEIPFRSVADLLKMPPDLYLGEASGVAVNSKGDIFVFSRGNTTGPAYASAAADRKSTRLNSSHPSIS